LIYYQLINFYFIIKNGLQCKPCFWDKKAVMLSSIEAWWAGLCAPPFDGAQGDNPPF